MVDMNQKTREAFRWRECLMVRKEKEVIILSCYSNHIKFHSLSKKVKLSFGASLKEMKILILITGKQVAQ